MSNVADDAANAVRDGKSAVANAAKSVVDHASQQASDVAGRVKDAGNQAAGYVRDQYDHLSDEARHAYETAREKAYGWEHSAEEYVQAKPVQALLIAAGIGVLVGLLWKRHD